MQTPVASQGFEYGVKHFFSPKSGLASEIISETLQIPQTDILYLINLGSVYYQSQRLTHDQMIENNQLVRVHTKPRRYSTNINWKERIIFESADFVILNKPGGIPSHPSVDNQIENALTQTAIALDKKLLITHRLDTLTEGLIVYGKTTTFVNAFNYQLKEKLITKKYIALIETTKNLPHRLIHYMEKTPRAPKNVSRVAQQGWDFCELIIEDQKILSHESWVKIHLLTGRTHQIRAQLAEMEAPLVGDILYGAKSTFKENLIALRAQEIEFSWNQQVHQFKLSESFDKD